jgi:Domain of unknown function (DUF4829)
VTRTLKIIVLLVAVLFLAAMAGGLIAAFGGGEETTVASQNHETSTTISTALVPATATASSATTLAQATTTAPSASDPMIAEQWARFGAARELAQHGYAAIQYKSPPAPDWNADLIVYGKVVKVDPARWSTPDGQPRDGRSDGSAFARIYTTFYIEPAEITGTPRFGTPIAIMVEFCDKLLSPGDEVLVFAEYHEEWRSGHGTWKANAYFSDARGIYMKVGEQYLNLDSGQPLASTATSEEGTAQAKTVLLAFFRAWGAKDLAAYKALLSERRREEMKLGDWTFAGLDRIEFGRVIPAPEVIELSIATYGYPYHRGNFAKDDVQCFRASVAWYYKPGVKGPTANGEELPWMWFLIREADGSWRVDGWGA